MNRKVEKHKWEKPTLQVLKFRETLQGSKPWAPEDETIFGGLDGS